MTEPQPNNESRAEGSATPHGREQQECRESNASRSKSKALGCRMPQGKYEFFRSDDFLVDPTVGPLDEKLRQFVRTYAALAAKSKRKSVCHSIDHADMHTLAMFAQRCAVFGIRERKVEFVRDGLIAASMINEIPMDSFDGWRSLCLLAHASMRLGTGTRALFSEVSQLSKTSIAEEMARFRIPYSSITEAPFVEIETKNGIGFAVRDHY